MSTQLASSPHAPSQAAAHDESAADFALSLARQATFHPDVDADHKMSLWKPHRHQVHPCSASGRSDACKLPLPPAAAPGRPSATAAAAPCPQLPQLQACWGLFSAASTREGDWLSNGCPGQRDREGQSVTQYMRTKLPRLRLAPARATIYLVPVGDVSAAPSFELLGQCVEVMLGLKVKQGKPVTRPQELSQIDVFGPGSG